MLFGPENSQEALEILNRVIKDLQNFRPSANNISSDQSLMELLQMTDEDISHALFDKIKSCGFDKNQDNFE